MVSTGPTSPLARGSVRDVTGRDEIVVSLVHDGAKEIISPRALRQLKYRALTLDMSCCKTIFLQELETHYGNAMVTGATKAAHFYRTSPPSPPLVTPTRLALAVQSFDDDEDEEYGFLGELFSNFNGKDNFVAMIALAYKHFIVVKSLETLARDRLDAVGCKTPSLKTSPFITRCQPPQLIDMIWHAHMLSPRAYAAAGASLIGAIIDHDPGYYNLQPAGHPSKLLPKLEEVFEYETRHMDVDDGQDWLQLANNSVEDIFGRHLDRRLGESYNDPGCG